MHSTLPSAAEHRIAPNANTFKAFLRLFYNLIAYIYWVDYTFKFGKLRKHIMAMVVQRISEGSLNEVPCEELNSLSSPSCSEDSYCSSSDDVMSEIESEGHGVRLSFRKLAQKRNLLVDDGNSEPPRGAKSPSILHSDACPSLILPVDSSSSSVLSDADKPFGVSMRPPTDFNLRLNSIASGTRDKIDSGSSAKSSLRSAGGCCEMNLSPIDSDDLSHQIVSNNKDLLLIDCRSFMKYNNNHILGALNACCTNPTIKKRFSDGKIGVLELISGVENKAAFVDATSCDACTVVIYDDDSATLADSNCLGVIASRLVMLGLEVRYLKGGVKEFLVDHSYLCSQPVVVERPILFSPTSPYVDAAIDSTTMTEILPHLYLGNEKDAANMERLAEQKITHILNVSATIPMFCELRMPGSFHHLRLPASDSGSQNIKQYFDSAIQFIEMALRDGGKVLVHCQAGVSRSPTITIAYLMAKLSRTSLDAFGEVKSKRVIISPNINFMGQLLEFESRSKDYF